MGDGEPEGGSSSSSSAAPSSTSAAPRRDKDYSNHAMLLIGILLLARIFYIDLGGDTSALAALGSRLFGGTGENTDGSKSPPTSASSSHSGIRLVSAPVVAVALCVCMVFFV
jgi:hypothetical protein